MIGRALLKILSNQLFLRILSSVNSYNNHHLMNKRSYVYLYFYLLRTVVPLLSSSRAYIKKQQKISLFYMEIMRNLPCFLYSRESVFIRVSYRTVPYRTVPYRTVPYRTVP
jgi:hypothetical protein